jgi:hypothetical protein
MAATSPGVTAYDEPLLGRAPRRAIRRRTNGLSFGAVAVGMMGGAVTLAAAWLLAGDFADSSGSDPNLKTAVTAALQKAAPVAAHGRFAAMAYAGTDARAPDATPKTDRLASKQPPLAAAQAAIDRQAMKAAEKDLSSRLRERMRAADAVPLPANRPAQARQTSRQAAVPAPAPVRLAYASEEPNAAFDLFTPAPMTGVAPAVTAARPAAQAAVALPAEPRREQKIAAATPAAAQPTATPSQAAAPKLRLSSQPAVTPAKPAQLAALPAATARPPVTPANLTQPNGLPGADSHTAIYDIEAHTVYMPNGARLEAHSGLGARIDDPHYIDERHRGPTPPNVYQLSLREGIFHGVRAIRLNPVDETKMHGRDGILAHTYMLGPTGQSFGCVSFKDYQVFLEAYLNGDVDRMIVVPRLETRYAAAR